MNSTIKQKKKKRPKFANLDPNYNLKTRWEQIADVSQYADTLDEKSKEWLNKFMGEYVGASFDKKRSNNIHPTKNMRKDCYDRNNARNRDILTKSHAMGSTVYLEELTNKDIKSDYEHNLIDAIDNGCDLNDFYPTTNIKQEVEVIDKELSINEFEQLKSTKTKRDNSRNSSE